MHYAAVKFFNDDKMVLSRPRMVGQDVFVPVSSMRPHNSVREADKMSLEVNQKRKTGKSTESVSAL
jgi:cold shock CspA family protein